METGRDTANAGVDFGTVGLRDGQATRPLFVMAFLVVFEHVFVVGFGSLFFFPL